MYSGDSSLTCIVYHLSSGVIRDMQTGENAMMLIWLGAMTTILASKTDPGNLLDSETGYHKRPGYDLGDPRDSRQP